MIKSLAQLKRDAKSGKIWMKCVEYYGDPNKVPEKMRMPRRLVDANSVDIFFLSPDGDRSACSIRRAALVEYTDKGLTVFNYGERDLTPEEQKVMDEWNAIESSAEFKEQARIDALSDGSSTYWQKKWFFHDKKMPWLTGWGDLMEYGKSYHYATGKVRDLNVRGEPILKYIITEAVA